MLPLIQFLSLAAAKLKIKALNLRASLICFWKGFLKKREEKRRVRKLIRDFTDWLDVIAERAARSGIKIPWDKKERLYFCFKMGVDPNTVSLNSLYFAITSERPIRDFFKPKKAEF